MATPSHPAQRIHLGKDEVLMAKVDYLQGSMGGFEKRTKWLMDWRYPFSSMAAGLFILTRIHNTGSVGGQVTLSTSEDATEELAVLDIPEADVVVSLCLFTQLIDTLRCLVPEGHASYESTVKAVRIGHMRRMLSMLRLGGVAIFLTDMASSDTSDLLESATDETIGDVVRQLVS